MCIHFCRAILFLDSMVICDKTFHDASLDRYEHASSLKTAIEGLHLTNLSNCLFPVFKQGVQPDPQPNTACQGISSKDLKVFCEMNLGCHT